MVWSLQNTLTFLQKFCVDNSIEKSELIDFIRLRYGRIFNKALRFYATEKIFTTVSGTKFYYLSREMNVSSGIKFFNQSNDNYEIKVKDYDDILSADPDESESGTPLFASFVELSSVQRQPDVATIFKIKSSSASDTVQKVTIVGRATDGTNEFEVTEEKQLTGTTFVSTSYSYVSIYDITKSGDTVGYVSIVDNAEAYIYSIIDPNSGRSEYQKWRLWPTPDSADTIKYTGYRRPRIPQNDSSMIDVPQDLEAGFIAGLRADVHDVNFDMVKSAKYEAMFEKSLAEHEANDTWNDGEEMSLVDDEPVYDPRMNLEDIPEDTE